MEQVSNELIKSAKDKILERVMGTRPDVNLVSDDDFYNAINQDYDNYDSLISSYDLSDQKIIQAFEKHPKLGQLFIKLINDEDPYLYMLDNFGDEIIDATTNPDMRHSSNMDYINGRKRIFKERDLERAAMENLSSSVSALEVAMYRTGVTEQEAMQAYQTLSEIMQDASVDKVSVDTWVLLLNGLRYTNDVEMAENNGLVRGRNSKIELAKRDVSRMQGAMPPQMSSYGDSVANSGSDSIEGALSRYGRNRRSIWDK